MVDSKTRRRDTDGAMDQTIECRFCTGVIPAHARKCKHCGEWVKDQVREQPPAGTAPRSEIHADSDQRVVCVHCHKKMVPRIITGPPLVRPSHGWTPVPKKSVCPFCAGTHMTFPASTGQKIAATVFIGIFVVIAASIAATVVGK